MRTIEVRDVATAKNPHGVDARQLFDAEHAVVLHIRLRPGESLRRHITPTNALFYVLEGTGIVEIGDERREAGRDTLIESPSGIPHRWLNETDEDLRILVIKAPRQTESTQLL